MSEDEMSVDNSDTQVVTAEYRDGHLQIVEVTPFEKDKGIHIVPDDSQTVQVQFESAPNDDGMMALGLLNLTLVKCDNSGDTYRLVSQAHDGSELNDLTDSTVTCVLQTSDGEEDTDNQQSYVMVEGEQGPLLYLQSPIKAETHSEQTQSYVKVEKKTTNPTPIELLERAKTIKKAKQILSRLSPARPGRRRGSDRKALREMMASPWFKLFLYSCTMCSFKCNAIKELTAHKASEHAGAVSKYRFNSGRVGAPGSIMQCAKCPFRGVTQIQLLNHIKEKHPSIYVDSNKICLNSKEVEEADILVCGACGFESASREVFREHLEREHQATTTI